MPPRVAHTNSLDQLKNKGRCVVIKGEDDDPGLSINIGDLGGRVSWS